jgi:hypothetical protein
MLMLPELLRFSRMPCSWTCQELSHQYNGLCQHGNTARLPTGALWVPEMVHLVNRLLTWAKTLVWRSIGRSLFVGFRIYWKWGSSNLFVLFLDQIILTLYLHTAVMVAKCIARYNLTDGSDMAGKMQCPRAFLACKRKTR